MRSKFRATNFKLLYRNQLRQTRELRKIHKETINNGRIFAILTGVIIIK
jgi:hypothetical protein